MKFIKAFLIWKPVACGFLIHLVVFGFGLGLRLDAACFFYDDVLQYHTNYTTISKTAISAIRFPIIRYQIAIQTSGILAACICCSCCRNVFLFNVTGLGQGQGTGYQDT